MKRIRILTQFFLRLDNEYAVEYLDSEYINTFTDCLEEGEGDRATEQTDEIHEQDEEVLGEEIDDEEIEQENPNEIESVGGSEEPAESDGDGAKEKQKRKYPYKCKKCSKRFVYKEVHDAHIRMHKGLPGFQ